jgi:hypothetical protein
VEQDNHVVTVIDHVIDVLEKREDAPNTVGNESECLSSLPVLAAAAPAGKTGFDRWSDVSSNYSLYSTSDDDQQEFKPNESWDFHDNDDDSEALVDDPCKHQMTSHSMIKSLFFDTNWRTMKNHAT